MHLRVEVDLHHIEQVSGQGSSTSTAGMTVFAQTTYGTGPGITVQAEGITWLSTSGWPPIIGPNPPTAIEDLWVEADTPGSTPDISYVSPTYGTIGDSNKTLTIDGEWLLNNDGSNPTITFYPSSLNATIYIQGTPSKAKITANYNIPSNAQPTLAYIVLTTDHGQAYGPDWEVGYPDADITDVEPQPWQAGWTGQPITISGSNLGTNSTVSIDPSDITISGLQFASDGSAITGYVTIPSTETEVEANITVTPGYSGCSGNCFFGDPQDSSGQSQSQSVPIVVVTPSYFVTNTSTQVSQPTNLCTGRTGYFLDLSNYVADQNGSRISISGIAPSETWNGSTNAAYSTPQTTRSDGSFDDTPYGSCFAMQGSYCQDHGTVTHGASYKGSSYKIPTTYTGRDCTQGIQIIITGNLSNENQTITMGTVY